MCKKMFTDRRWRGAMRRTRRDAERNVPPGIPESSSVRFASGSPPLLGSWMVTGPSPLLYVFPYHCCSRTCELARISASERERRWDSPQVRADRSQILTSTGETSKSTKDVKNCVPWNMPTEIMWDERLKTCRKLMFSVASLFTLWSKVFGRHFKVNRPWRYRQFLKMFHIRALKGYFNSRKRATDARI